MAFAGALGGGRRSGLRGGSTRRRLCRAEGFGRLSSRGLSSRGLSSCRSGSVRSARFRRCGRLGERRGRAVGHGGCGSRFASHGPRPGNHGPRRRRHAGARGAGARSIGVSGRVSGAGVRGRALAGSFAGRRPRPRRRRGCRYRRHRLRAVAAARGLPCRPRGRNCRYLDCRGRRCRNLLRGGRRGIRTRLLRGNWPWRRNGASAEQVVEAEEYRGRGDSCGRG